MDPVIDEMRRVKGPQDIRESKWRDWVQYLCALWSKQEAEIAALRVQLAERKPK